jgi:mono/diheme cytochrome c family protein
MKHLGRASLVLALLLAPSVLSACKQDPQPEPPKPAPKPATPVVTATATATAAATAAAGELPGGEEAQKLFKTKCIVCHGEKGEGNGTGAAALTVKPRNYTDGRWQKSVTDEQIETIILKGGGAVGKDPGMPANPELKNKPEVIQDLRKIVRSFAKSVPDAGAPPAASASASAGAAAKKPPKAPAKKAP